jgi:alkylhydroperoxidase family enzyme
MPWIRTIAPEEATGRLRRIYDDAVKRAGRVFHIVRSMSLTPRALGASMEMYKAVMFGPGKLSRRRREMLAVVVSRVNDCHY